MSKRINPFLVVSLTLLILLSMLMENKCNYCSIITYILIYTIHCSHFHFKRYRYALQCLRLIPSSQI